ncbi:hypothetical protein [Agrococcus jejuensis]|uniref:Uncharacterized protein n=1 Tax=Agrococcus jejuensis TaxID=399736 RepID=A0A1G8ELA9_9MICO|nr:hypothetical protein [Agrococcus jejuensis]SDH70641.1 hypothetical protein SAMN04489720_2089 [Agrococcus jejuensis]
MPLPRRAPITAALAAIASALVLAGCAGDPAPSPSPSETDPAPSASASPEPEASASALPFVMPETADGDLARAEHAIVDGVPTTPSIAIAPMVAGQPVAIEGQCTGGASMTFRLERAVDAEPDERLLMEGTIECDADVAQVSTITAPYAGPVQLTIAPGEGVTEAWAVARLA